jgi:hypothetical protein
MHCRQQHSRGQGLHLERATQPRIQKRLLRRQHEEVNIYFHPLHQFQSLQSTTVAPQALHSCIGMLHAKVSTACHLVQ